MKLQNILIGGAALLALIAFSSQSKPLNGLGDLDTARTAKGRKRQRGAVFAKLDEKGKAWPKKNGRRVRPVRKKRKTKR